MITVCYKVSSKVKHKVAALWKNWLRSALAYSIGKLGWWTLDMSCICVTK